MNGTVYNDSTGAGVGFGGGVVVQNCLIAYAAFGCRAVDANLSSTFPMLVKNCHFYQCGTATTANVLGQLVENYNRIQATTARTNVSAGANSVSTANYAPLMEGGYGHLNDLRLRPFFQPLSGSPQLGFGNDSTPAALTTDLYGRPRPAGGASTSLAVGAEERHDTAAKETSVTDAGSVGLKITGPGDQDIRVPVNAVATVLSVRVQYDTNHGTGSKPQAILLANGEITVTTETKTATVGVDTWETLTFSSFTPTAKGAVTIRLVSRAAAGSGIAYFDTMVAPAINLGDFGHFVKLEPLQQVSGAGSGLLVHPGMDGGIRG